MECGAWDEASHANGGGAGKVRPWVQVAFAGVNVLYKLAVNDGMSLRVVVAYRFVFATSFIAPLALVLERKKRPKMTWTILFQAFFCGLFGGVLAQNLYLEALALTSATFASAMSNLIPAITFIMAVSVWKKRPKMTWTTLFLAILSGLFGGALAQTFYLETLALTSATFASAMNNLNPAVTFVLALCFGMERFNLGTAAGKAKIIGTLTGIGGAMVLTFLKGAQIDIGSFHVNLLHHHHNGHVASLHSSSGGSPILGALSALGGSFSFALWLIIQTKMSKRYPNLSSTTLMSLTASVLCIAFALCLERDWSEWRLAWNVRLLTVAYSGIMPAGVVVIVISWCVHMRGPLFVSVFAPLQLVMVAIAGYFMLDEKLHLGSIIGAVLIVCGLYAVLWGKAEEMKKMNLLVPSPSLPVSGTVEIVVKSPVNDKDNDNNNNAVMDRNHEDSSENGGEVVHDSHNRKKEQVVVIS